MISDTSERAESHDTHGDDHQQSRLGHSSIQEAPVSGETEPTGSLNSPGKQFPQF